MGIYEELFGPKRKKNTYAKGMRAERIIKQRLERKGWLVKQSRGSRGPDDLYAMKGGRKMRIQVKSGGASVSRRDIARLKRAAQKSGATAVVMRVRRGRIRSRFV